MKTFGPAPLRHRDFALYFGGALLSNLGSRFTTVAMAWQIYELTNSAFQIGLLGLARAVPQMALALFGGIMADAVDRRKFLMLVQLANCAVSTSLVILTVAGIIQPYELILANVLFAFGSAMDTPSRQAVIPNLVPREELRAGIALNNTQRQVALVVGPSLAGVALAFSGSALCYAIDASSWFAMVVGLLLINRPLQGATRARPSLQAIAEGARFVWSQQVIFSFMILDFGATFFGSSQALLPIYARDILHAGPVGLGVLYAAGGVGSVLAATAMSTAFHIDQAGRWVLSGVTLYGLCTIGFAFSHQLWLSVLLLLGTGLGNTAGSVLRGTSNQLLTPDHLRGRVSAVNSIFTNGGPQLGQFESGVVAAAGGAPLSALTGGLGALLMVGAIALLPRVRQFTLSSATAAEAVALA